MNTRKYEALYIVAPTMSDSEVKAIAERFKGVVETQGGTVEKAEKWEKRKMAYEVGGHREGNYIIMLFEAEGKIPAELSRQMRNSDDVLRHRIYLKED
ncbi:MAG: 30S ribosomal protein S6 [Armatimonadetes bacterium]|nr:30S ribosomal protein S6 [Armatimonadota bacterium]